jgi:hypothetical protein
MDIKVDEVPFKTLDNFGIIDESAHIIIFSRRNYVTEAYLEILMDPQNSTNTCPDLVEGQNTAR